jgi:hypothetical protein
MVCKNEAKYIGDTLAAVKPFINCWSVLDTGSTDGTQDIVRKVLGDLPGQLHERAWRGWDKSRTESVDLARLSGCDFILLLDADEKFTAPEGFTWPVLDSNVTYWVTIQYGGIRYTRPNLLSVKHIWLYIGVTHEYLYSPDSPRQELLPLTLVTHPTRCNKAPEKCAEDARILEEALVTEPDNSRYVFYLAQSYRDSLQFEKAIEMYKKRATMGGWAEELFISLLRVAQLSEGRRTFREVAEAYTKAYEARPQRAGEVFSSLARFCQWWADGTAYPAEDCLFVDAGCYKLGPAKPAPSLRVLVVIPTHDRTEFLEEALFSLKQQTRPANEVIVIGNVKPRTEGYATFIPAGGEVATRLNTAIKACNCDAFIMLGDDDKLEKDFIAKTAEVMERTGVDIVHTQYRHFGKENCVTGSAQHIPVTSLCRKSIWEKVGGYTPGVPYFDWDFWWSCRDAGAKSVHIPEPLWRYRIHDGQVAESEETKKRNQDTIRSRHQKG